VILLAQYGFNVTTISRLKGKSVVRTLAYILREKLYDEYKGKTYDYSYSKDYIYHEVLLPDNAPPEFENPVTLCNEMEKAERRYDGRTGRIVWMSLPNELEPDDWIELVKDFTNKTYVSMGMCAIALG
jgi:hypothetical protein